MLDVPGWKGHVAGQHLDVRLTAPDGYQAERSYSLASDPADPRVAITIQKVPDGEVSPYLFDGLREGDSIEIRGPVGGYFTWDPSPGGPVQLIAGGSGVVPLACMLRHHVRTEAQGEARLLYSARTMADVIYSHDLQHHLNPHRYVSVDITLTREEPTSWTGLTGRVDADMLTATTLPPHEDLRTYVCGPTPFVETVANLLIDLGHDPTSIRTERFGPTGGSS
ncbi:ferredoxin reductase [Nocardioides aestuarii]